MDDLQALILSSDPGLVVPIRSALKTLNAKAEIQIDVGASLSVCARRHFDAVIIDCDDVPGACSFVTKVRQARSSRFATIVVVVNGKTGVHAALKSGANVVINKPVSMSRIQPCLGAVGLLMKREHWRYFRHQVKIPLSLNYGYKNELSIAAQTITVSQEGLEISWKDPIDILQYARVSLKLRLPPEGRPVVEATAHAVWVGRERGGFHLQHMSQDSRARFDLWLADLRRNAQAARFRGQRDFGICQH